MPVVTDVRRGVCTCVGWQVTLCDPIWQLTSRSSEMGFPWRAIYRPLPFFTFILIFTHITHDKFDFNIMIHLLHNFLYNYFLLRETANLPQTPADVWLFRVILYNDFFVSPYINMVCVCVLYTRCVRTTEWMASVGHWLTTVATSWTKKQQQRYRRTKGWPTSVVLELDPQ